MYAVVAGGGKVGANVTRSLVRMGHEVTLVEQRRDRFEQLEAELGPIALQGDATEIHVLERAGIARPPEIVLAVTGDDEDNIVISQIAKERYRVPKAIARVNDPRNQSHFDILGITQTVCATSGLLGLVEHEVPEHGSSSCSSCAAKGSSSSSCSSPRTRRRRASALPGSPSRTGRSSSP